MAGGSWLVKTDSAGSTQWDITYTGTINSIIEANEGGYVLAGSITGDTGGDDFWLTKIDTCGNVQWEQTYGGPKDDEGFFLVETCKGEYAVAGVTYSFDSGNAQFWLVKFDCGLTALFVVPEVSFEVLGAISACFAALAVVTWHRRHKSVHTPKV